VIDTKEKERRLQRRHRRLRQRLRGTPDRPRLCVHRSLRHIYAQIVDDQQARTLVAASTLDKEVCQDLSAAGNVAAASKVGGEIARRALAAGIHTVVFDRGGYLYHGRIKALAEGARQAGLKFER